MDNFEKLIAKSSLPSEQATILSETARSIQKSFLREFSNDKVVNTVAACLVSPLSFLYVWWVILAAMKHGTKRLYFLSRDGQIFYKVAKVLVEAWKIDIEIQYFYCSRESLLLPSFDRTGHFEEYWITSGFQNRITISEICNRLNLKNEDIVPLLGKHNLAECAENLKTPISHKQRPVLCALLHDDRFMEMVTQSSRTQFENTLSYALQEGMGDGVPFALVDTGWNGSSQYALNKILSKGGVELTQGIKGYYIGVNRDAYIQGGDSLYGFLFDWRNSRRDSRLFNFICFEMLFSGLHGRTIRYLSKDGRINPVMANGLIGYPLEIVTMQHQAAERYANACAQTLEFDDFKMSAAAALGRRLMRQFICYPSVEMVSVYGDWPMGGEIRETDQQVVAPSMNMPEFFRYALGKEQVKGFWHQASLVRGNQRFLLSFYNFIRTFGFILDWYCRLILKY